MKYAAFPYQQRPCPKCGMDVPSTVVYVAEGSTRGIDYTVHECAICGTLVHRIIGFDIANPSGSNQLFVEPVESQTEIEAVCQAAESAR